MRVLYGVVGEGMGHATRSAVVVSHLVTQGHTIRVVVSGRAHEFLTERFRAVPSVAIEEIEGLTLRYFGNRVDRAGSLFWNLKRSPRMMRKNIAVYREVAESGFRPDVVISDFETFAALYGLRFKIPVVSIDNLQIINRCRHPKPIKHRKRLDFRLAQAAVKAKVPRAYHYLITTFFHAPPRRKFTTLVPPILRDEVRSVRREPGEHVVVYQRALGQEALLEKISELPYEFRVYGESSDEDRGNVKLRPFSSSGFLDDLRTARAVIAGGGFSLMSEAVSLGVPILSVPIEHQYEQELNARYLERLGYGARAAKLTKKRIASFLESTDDYAKALEGYDRRGNERLYGALDELLNHIARGEKRPARLELESA